LREISEIISEKFGKRRKADVLWQQREGFRATDFASVLG
jgi:hypothetical protein